MKFYSLIAFLAVFFGVEISAQSIEVKESLEANTVCASAGDLHLTSKEAPMKAGVTVNITSGEAWLFFDNMKPKNVLKKYGNSILINGEVLKPTVNGRIGMYKQGTVIMPHAAGFQPLETFTERDLAGSSARYVPNKYYCNAPGESVPAAMRMPLAQDNQIRSFKLKRGYMATFANEPDGMGYSRVFIADDKDLVVTALPAELDGKVSYVRVFKWEYASKKGWAGSVWKEQVEGLKYAPQQCDITNSTWYYNWGATPTEVPGMNTPDYGVEFIPEKWGAGGSWEKIFGVENASHLLSYNEPDHSEQSHVSVAKAIEEWPMLMQTGMRLGSPATTDFSWLYNFMDECRKRNYRVDYVVIHAYWGGITPDQWYKQMKEVHDRTGRPIWIKEWNNGANWTHESWPSGTAAQQEKQLRDLKGILEVMDTTSWIERYSIYNWVEDKRMMLLTSGVLTPAGEYYAQNSPDFAFNRIHEVIPEWTVREQPVIAYDSYSVDKGYAFSIGDANGELIDRFVVERAFVKAGESSVPLYQTIATIPGSAQEYTDKAVEGSGTVYYRLRSLAFNGKSKTSNVLSYRVQESSESASLIGSQPINTTWSLLTAAEPYEQNPVVVLGATSFVNKSPLSNRVRKVSTGAFELKLAAYEYLGEPVYTIPDTLAYLALPEGTYDWEGITSQASSVEGVNQNWEKVRFATPFEVIPVVFATQTTDHVTTATSVRVKNITKEGFELALQYEGELDPNNVSETVSYLAVTPGEGKLGQRIVKVGRTPQASVGDERSGGYRIDYGKPCKNSLFFGAMQTVNDENTAALRVKKRTDTYAEVLKDYEKSGGSKTVEKETVGWMAIGAPESGVGIEETSADQVGVFYDPASDWISIFGGSDLTLVELYSLEGIRLLQQLGTASLSLGGLVSGIYIVKVNGKSIQKLIKQ